MSRHRHPDNSRARPTWLPTPTRTGLGVGAMAAVFVAAVAAAVALGVDTAPDAHARDAQPPARPVQVTVSYEPAVIPSIGAVDDVQVRALTPEPAPQRSANPESTRTYPGTPVRASTAVSGRSTATPVTTPTVTQPPPTVQPDTTPPVPTEEEPVTDTAPTSAEPTATDVVDVIEEEAP